MFLRDNPFHLLGAGPFDDRERLAELVDGLPISQEGGEAAWALLTHPRRRLAAELAWLPGLAPDKYQGLFKALEGAEPLRPALLRSLPPLAGCNLAAEFIWQKPDMPDGKLFRWALEELPAAFESVCPDDLLESLNTARKESGFLEVNRDFLVEELQKRREAYLELVGRALSQRSTAALIRLMLRLAKKCKGLPPLLAFEFLEIYAAETWFFSKRRGRPLILSARLWPLWPRFSI